ncbi:hypothetical protein C8Q79DRAFT_961776 [Trametes meyenii]|nr:hypothetical protein C8Q79DRAFT_961776 [Trametes meyenii]
MMLGTVVPGRTTASRSSRFTFTHEVYEPRRREQYAIPELLGGVTWRARDCGKAGGRGSNREKNVQACFPKSGSLNLNRLAKRNLNVICRTKRPRIVSQPYSAGIPYFWLWPSRTPLQPFRYCAFEHITDPDGWCRGLRQNSHSVTSEARLPGVVYPSSVAFHLQRLRRCAQMLVIREMVADTDAQAHMTALVLC